jgi:hypothetical protein
MFAKSKIIRLAFWACLAAAWLPIGNSLLSSQATAGPFARVGPIVRGGVIVRSVPVVRVAPVVTVAPVVRTVPVYHQVWYRRWNGFRWFR